MLFSYIPEALATQVIVEQGSQTQFPCGPLEAVFGCGRAAIGIP